MNWLIAGLAAVLASPAAPVRSATATLQHRVDAAAPGLLKTHDVPAAAVAFIADGEIAWARAYGEQAPGVPATIETLFNVASLAKPVTAEVVLRLASKGALSLDEPLSPHWIDPDVEADPRHAKLTPRIALTHRTGFKNWRPNDGALTLQAEPGTTTGYSGEGYRYLGRFVEKKLGRPFEALAEEAVFGPLGMRSTFFNASPAMAGRVAVVQGPDGTRRLPDVKSEWNGADDLHVSVTDYARLVTAAMRSDGLSAEVAAARGRLHENMVGMACPKGRIAPELCPKSVGFGLGWVSYDNGREPVMLHGGGDWGERALAFYVPSRRMGMVVFTSGANGQKVIRDLVGMVYPENRELNAFLAMQAE